MDNIIKKLKDRNITSQIKYYGTNDFATGFEIKNIVENYDLYNELIDQIKPVINNIDDYVNYLYIRCLKEYREVIPNVRDDLKEKVENIVFKTEEKFVNYKIEDLSKFIAKNYNSILTNEFKGLYIKHDVIDFTIEYIANYCKKDKKAMEYIVQNYSYKVYDKFKIFKKMFDKSKDLHYYDLLLTKERLKKDVIYRLEKITKVLIFLKDKNEKLYNDKINILIDIYKKETFGATIDDVMNKYFRLGEFVKTLEKLKHPKYYEFQKEYERQSKIKDEYILKNGYKQDFTIDIKPIIEIIENENVEWYIKSLSITHSKKGKKMISVFDGIMKKAGKKGIIDYVTSDIETDDTFSYSIINALSITLLYGKHIINYMISDDTRLNNLLAYIMSGVNNYFKKDSMYFEKEKFELDINMVFDAIKELKSAYNQKNDIKVKRIIYGLETQLCGIIEKVLRKYKQNVKKDQEYISFDSETLNSLLKDEMMKKELGIGNCQCIQYLLLKRNGNVGKNTRNDFAHYNDEIYDKLNLDIILETLYILLVISNTLLCKEK